MDDVLTHHTTPHQPRFSNSRQPWGRTPEPALNGRWLLVCLTTLLSTLLAGTQSIGLAAETPLGRSTTDRQADLIEACLRAGFIDDARAVCQREYQATPPGSFQQAIWAVRLSSVAAAKLRELGDIDDERWKIAARPVDQLLEQYPDEQATPWLKLQRHLLALSQSELRLLIARGRSEPGSLLEQVETGLRQAISQLRTLDQEIGDLLPQAPKLRAQLEQSKVAHHDDLFDLQRIVRRRITEAMLLRADVYPAGSDDSIAAATAARDAANHLIASLNRNSSIRGDVIRMLARATRMAGEPRAAVDLLEPAVRSGNASAETLAEWLLAQMQQGNIDVVSQAFKAYYGSDPVNAPRSLEMDLVRLQFLIAESQRAGGANPTTQQAISDWVQMVGQRGGAYAKRRAEQTMLDGFQSEPGQLSTPLVVAQAAQLVRGGTPREMATAAELFQQASSAADVAPEEAFKYGAQSAACWMKAGETLLASRQFSETGRRFPTQPRAEAFHFESARLLATLLKEPTPELLDELRHTLVNQLLLWPEGELRNGASQWAIEVFAASQQPLLAGAAALHIRPDSPDWTAAIRSSGVHFRRALQGVPAGDERAALGTKLLTLLNAAVQNNVRPSTQLSGDDTDPSDALLSAVVIPDDASKAILNEEMAFIAAATLNHSQLRERWIEPPQAQVVGDQSPLSFAYDLRRVRIDAIDPQSLALAPPNTADRRAIIRLAIERLHADAVTDPSLRSMMGRAIIRIAGELATAKSLQTMAGALSAEDRSERLMIADALAWAGDWQLAQEVFMTLAHGPPSNAESLQHGARTLSQLNDIEAAKAAVSMWNRLAGGLRMGTEAWHEARLATIEAMVAAGDKEGAAKLARFVLLTQTPSDPRLAERYQQHAEPTP